MSKYLILLMLLSLGGCGAKQKRCYAKTETSFATFLDDEWRAYCDKFDEITENSEEFPLLEVTVFLTDHEEKAEELRSKLARYDKVDTCFSTGREQLEYRKLNSCLNTTPEQEIRLIDSWKTAIDPFLEDLKLTIGSTKPRLNDAEREADFLLRKARESLDLSKKTDRARFTKFQELVEETAEDVGKLEDSLDAYDEVLEAAEENEALSEELELEVTEQVEALRGDIEDQGKRVGDLRESIGFLQIVEDTAGKSCPTKGIAQVKETKIAIKELRNYFVQIESGRIRIDKRISKSSKDGKKIEKFSGYACGLRKSEDQFPNTLPLCTVHRFTIQREKSGRRWGGWDVVKKAEGDLSEGVDCKRTD